MVVKKLAPDEKDSNAEWWKLADAWGAQPKVKLFKVLTQRLRVSAIRKKLLSSTLKTSDV